LMTTNPYVEDILSQPAVLEAMLRRLDLTSLEPVRKKLRQGAFDRIVITGMGASNFGAYPAWLLLCRSGIPACWVDTAELVHYASGLVTERTLLWAVSQSGRSAELANILQPDAKIKPGMILALTNDPASPLAERAEINLAIDAPEELTVSTRTYVNTLAISQLAALYLTGNPFDAALDELAAVSRSLRSYFGGWQDEVDQLVKSIGLPRSLVILGRGPSMAAAQMGALIQGEASKYPALSMNAAEFRHGPLEMVRDDLTIVALAGPKATVQLNLRLAEQLSRLGARVFWVGAPAAAGLASIAMPPAEGVGLPIAEVAPFQLLSLALAGQMHIEAGKFLHSGKVTLTE